MTPLAELFYSYASRSIGAFCEKNNDYTSCWQGRLPFLLCVLLDVAPLLRLLAQQPHGRVPFDSISNAAKKTYSLSKPAAQCNGTKHIHFAAPCALSWTFMGSETHRAKRTLSIAVRFLFAAFALVGTPKKFGSFLIAATNNPYRLFGSNKPKITSRSCLRAPTNPSFGLTHEIYP